MSVDPFGLPPEEAIRWFREKGYRPAFDWRDVWNEQHARAFTVAKATQLDVLADLREAVDKAIRSGGTLGEFRKELKPLLQAKGWWGEKEVDVLDPEGKPTGERKLVQLGSANRLRTIYETNLRQAQAAGRWERMERTKQARPYARYVALLDGNERPEHREWHGTVLPIDDPWWDTHAPPNGWGCRCKMQQLSQRDLERYGYSVNTSPPPSPMRTWRNDRTGETVRVPRGIDPGFAYNPGKAPRGWTKGTDEKEVPLANLKTWADLGLPPIRDLRQGEAVERWHDLKGIEDADARYVQLFGTGRPVEVKDPTGAQVTFDPKYMEHLYRSGGLARLSFLPRAKQTVEAPTEIWLVPHRVPTANRVGNQPGEVVMRKVYIGAFEGRDLGYAVVAHRTREGFVAWTLVPVRELDGKRQGYRVWPPP